jgi:urease accessory protein
MAADGEAGGCVQYVQQDDSLLKRPFVMPHIINHRWPHPISSRQKIPLWVDRHTLAKRRWQGSADDGADFGFDLETPLHHGDIIFETDTAQYVLSQKPEPVLEVPLGEPVEAARTAWSLGNLHFPIEVRSQSIRVVDDPAARLCLERDHIPFKSVTDIFHPIKAIAQGHSHGHTHAH